MLSAGSATLLCTGSMRPYIHARGTHRREKACKGTTFFLYSQIIRKENAKFLSETSFFARKIHFAKCSLQNKEPNTTYYAYLQSACGESGWTQVYSFTTQEEVSIPYQYAK